MRITYFGVSIDILLKYIDKFKFKIENLANWNELDVMMSFKIFTDNYSVFVYQKESQLKSIWFQHGVQIKTLI